MSRQQPWIRVAEALSSDEVASVLELADDAARADGSYPLSEHVVLHLRHGGGHSLHLLAGYPDSTDLLGYAHLEISDAAEGPAAELAVRPGARRQGIGGALIDEVVRESATRPGRLRLWAHGADAAASELAAVRGFHQVRRLLQLRRSLFAPLEDVVLPPGVTLRNFEPAADIDAWLELNARVFTELPDQGGWTRRDLEQRMAEPWFEPGGFLIAEDVDGRLVGFHWTKVHAHGHGRKDGNAGHQHPHEPIGEVYVVGVDPDARGNGLGRALTLAGLHHLRSRCLSTALLYVDSDNAAALSLYRSLGFAAWDSDTLFRR